MFPSFKLILLSLKDSFSFSFLQALKSYLSERALTSSLLLPSSLLGWGSSSDGELCLASLLHVSSSASS